VTTLVFGSLLEPPARRRADRARQVVDAVRPALAAARVGDLLPGENDLARQFDVSRNTVREALDLLRSEGLLERIPGVGTVVTTPRLTPRIDSLVGLAETLSGHAAVRNVVLTAEVGPADERVMQHLDLSPGADVLRVERLRLADDAPFALDVAHVVPDLGEGLLARDLGRRDLLDLLEEGGTPLAGATVTLEAESADDHVADALGTTLGAPLLRAERLTRSTEGRAVALQLVRLRGDRTTLTGEVRRERAGQR
jgi:GntR family transcriptional regulator